MRFSKQQRIDVYSKFNGRCAYCGIEIPLKDMQIDHIISQDNFVKKIKNKSKIPVFLRHLTELDMNHIDNLNPSCRVCNKWKNYFDLEVFRIELSEQVKRLNDYSSNYRIAKRYGQITETTKPICFYFETLLKNYDEETKI
jgi:5-methylcytosine-specific restriction endonuclease McrA